MILDPGPGLASAMPVIFMMLMGLAMLAYVTLDGFDLGVGMLLPLAPDADDKDVMVASIGPFWDANETWLVLGVGVLLIAFPVAHGVVLQALYLPVAAMLVGLILRGVAFDFRVKARDHHRIWWNRAFFSGSLLAAFAQGWMLGRYVTGFADGAAELGFALVIACALPAGYVMLGATWLLIRTEGELQVSARRWARRAWLPLVIGLAAISLATPWVSATVRERWFGLPQLIALMPIPLATVAALIAIRVLLASDSVLGRWAAVPFILVIGVFTLGFFGLAYSLYPYVVIDRLTIWEAASAPESMALILIGVAFSVPAIIGYTVFAYSVFSGKTRRMDYG